MSDSRETCSFFVSRKNRNCKMVVQPGLKFCAQHVPLENDEDNKDVRRRIPCPLDSKHTCFEDGLRKHLKICNAREKPQPVYYEKNINSGDGITTYIKLPLKDVSHQKLLSCLDKLEKVFSDKVDKTVQEQILTCEILDEELKNPTYGHSVLKHLKQNSSILGILKKNDLLDGQDTCFVEFGAGRGQLSHWLIQATKRIDSTSFVLIDRSSQRHKFDNRYKVENGPNITRLKIDIEHLNLGFVNAVEMSKKVVAVSKHLCGAATDLTLKCLTNYNKRANDSDTNRNKVKGLLIALCCHHRCSWTSFVGRKYMEEYGFDEEDFNVLTSVASWMTCGSRKGDVASEETENKYYLQLGLRRERREELGFKSKMLLNYYRSLFLNDHKYNSWLLYYTDKKTSLENVALLAYDSSI